MIVCLLCFVFVQLTNFEAPERNSVGWPSAWYVLRESQLDVYRRLKNVGMAVTIDLAYPDPKDVHPRNKKPFGERLALAALGVAHERDFVYSGPIFESMTVRDGRAILGFGRIGGGLVAKEGKDLRGFTLCGPDRKFHEARATIEGRTVVVTYPDVKNPTAVRYAWANNPTCNLYNAEGLPASPFRTDTFEIRK